MRAVRRRADGSNGASQAILDARVLARALALSTSVPEALAIYEAERLPATAKLVWLNRRVGAERCMEIVEQRYAPKPLKTAVFDPKSPKILKNQVGARFAYAFAVAW